MQYIQSGGLKISQPIYDLVKDEIAPGTGIDTEKLWSDFSDLVGDLTSRNETLLQKRIDLQAKIDRWHLDRKDKSYHYNEYYSFLEEIGYIVPEPEAFAVVTENVDPEIATVAGPQLVVPVDNARYSLNAANARWGSLYDALYGADVIPKTDGLEKSGAYNPKRGEAVFQKSYEILDQFFPLAAGSYAEVNGFSLNDEGGSKTLSIQRENSSTALKDSDQFIGYTKTQGALSSIWLRNNGLHIELQIDADHPIGKVHPADIKDIVLESAITTIQDFEDSVAAVDAEDKALVYRNWTGLMKGTLETTFDKAGKPHTRCLNADKTFTSPSGEKVTLPGRSLMLARNVGIRMSTDAVLTEDNQEIPEGFLDALMASLAAMHDLKGNGTCSNSKTGSVYIVKPKMHGPEEVAFTVELFSRVEGILSLPRNTLKIGIMDEERRTTVNLKECIRQAKDRIVFINTGFLDRTGDEIHTSMEAGPVIPKMEIKNAAWMLAYEDWNVDMGIETSLPGKAQIGKGMWAMPDEMKAMLNTKSSHPKAGANTAWVPSPTAATLHALHYHEVNVFETQRQLASRKRASIENILTLPLLHDRTVSQEEIEKEIENNAQGILGYVVRWIDQGVGCSKVPDINNVGLMEDRATLRISSQHIANWLYHGIVRKDFVINTLKRVAAMVDKQNADDPNYQNMSPDFDDNIAFQTALGLIFQGREEPSGYTEPALHRRRREAKAKALASA